MPRASSRDRIVARLQPGRPRSASDIARRLGLTLPVASRHLAALVKEGRVAREGEGRRVRFVLPSPSDSRSLPLIRRYPLAVLSEDRVWQEVVGLHLALHQLPGDALEIFRYAFTEMLNNAIEHSQGTLVEIRFEAARDGALAFELSDNGVGLFRSLRGRLALESEQAAAHELARGTVSRLPSGRAGAGILVTARASRHFEVQSAGFRWMVDNSTGMAVVASAPGRPGTRIRFEGELHPRRRLRDLFVEYGVQPVLSRTRVVVTLGTGSISRAEAQRLLNRLERFNTVVLDFKDVEEIGQSFADEVFRVWLPSHPNVTLEPINMSPLVSFMIEHARR